MKVVAAAIGGTLAFLVLVVYATVGVIANIAGFSLDSTSYGGTVCANPSGQRSTGLSDPQWTNAAVIVHVGQSMDAPEYGWVIAVATALQESDLTNLRTATDHDSLGLFQQRPSAGWGTPQQLTNPTYAARKFYQALLRVPGWQSMPLTVAAQRVQESAYPDAYAKHESRARAIVAALTDCSSAGTWVAPVRAPIVSGFRTRQRPDHDGVDLAAARGTRILAASGGVVVTSRCDPDTGDCNRDGSLSVAGCGWYVEIRHPGDITSRYCHMERRPMVRVGQRVTAGQPIGVVGMSGNASGPHCHFEIHDGYPATHGNAVSPTIFMREHGVILGSN